MSDSDVLVRFGQRVRQRRQRLGMRITILARRASLTPNYVSSVELGRRNPSLLALLAIAKGLDMHAGDLLGGTSKLSPAGIEAGACATPCRFLSRRLISHSFEHCGRGVEVVAPSATSSVIHPPRRALGRTGRPERVRGFDPFTT